MTDAQRDDLTPDEAETAIRDLLAANGVTMEATFIPFSQSRHAKPGADGKPRRSLNWRVTLSRAGRPFLESDYSAGEAHAPSYNQGAPRTRDYMAALDFEIESGYPAARFGAVRRSGSKPIMPDVATVVSCLAMDGGAINQPSFEEWAADFGYDPDSRKAEAIYKACVETGLKLRAALGNDVFERLSDLARQL